MKTVCTLLSILLASLAIAADPTPVPGPPAGKYSLSVANVYKSELQARVFIIGGMGQMRGGEIVFLNAEDLKAFLEGMVRGSTLDWWPGCDLDASSVLGPHLKEMKRICAEAGVTFTIHPSG